MAQIDPATFRTNFPAFSNTTSYPDAVIQFYLTLAYLLLQPLRWGSLLDFGAQLWAAHNLVQEFIAQQASAKGAPPGMASGAVAGKTVGPLTMSFDTANSAVAGAGQWNDTTYGRRYKDLENLVGMGGLQLGVGSPPFALGVGSAWVGPPPWPGWFSS
jgi:hypothetical protein